MARDLNDRPLAAGDRVLLPCVQLPHDDPAEGYLHLRAARADSDGGLQEFFLHESQLCFAGEAIAVPCLVTVAQSSDYGRNLLLEVSQPDGGNFTLTFAVAGRQVVKEG